MAEGERLRCMEVFGGSEPASRAVALGGLDAWVDAVPHAAAAAGGDVYYVSSCATGRITRLLIADVSGHGAIVADVAKTLRGIMRVHVNHLDQRRFVARMNDAFVEQSTRGLFATAVICTYFAPTRSLSLCNAGHPPPIFYRAADRAWRILESDPDEPDDRPVRNVPLGILGDTSYEQFRVTMAAGDRVLVYTDSLIEAIDETTGDEIGVRGLCDAINALPTDLAADAVVPALLDALRARVGASLAKDDVTTLLFTPNLASEHASFATRAVAPFRWLRRAINWRADGTQRLPWPDLTIANVGGALVPALNRLWRH